MNPYRGCEHGCVYCYARPTHAYLGLSPGLDFESRLFQKPDAAAQLERELAAPGYRPATLVLGANTDPYQPIERHYRITRALLQVLHDCRHPVAITTKSALILRDLDLLAAMAQRRLAAALISITTLDRGLARRMEPRAAAPVRRLEVIQRPAQAGVPVGVLVSPLIPGLTDPDLERILELAAQAGASRAGSILIRLPLEVAGLFEDWLRAHYPERAGRVLQPDRPVPGRAAQRSQLRQPHARQRTGRRSARPTLSARRPPPGPRPPPGAARQRLGPGQHPISPTPTTRNPARPLPGHAAAPPSRP